MTTAQASAPADGAHESDRSDSSGVGPGSQAERIAGTLRDEILRGQYREGERLPSERDLAQRFGTTRGSVREAVKKLEQLGLACVRPGGARVAPRDEASLEVVAHLLHLESPPHPLVVDQVVEALGIVSLGAARLAMERASDDEIARARTIAGRIRENESIDAALLAFRELTDLFVEASGNLVLQLVRRGLRTQLEEHVRPPLEAHGSAAEAMPMLPALPHLDSALAERDAVAVTKEFGELLAFLRGVLQDRLRAARRDLPPAGPTESPGSRWLTGTTPHDSSEAALRPALHAHDGGAR